MSPKIHISKHISSKYKFPKVFFSPNAHVKAFFILFLSQELWWKIWEMQELENNLSSDPHISQGCVNHGNS